MNKQVPAATPTIGAALGGILAMATAPYTAAIPGAPQAIAMIVPGFFAWLAHRLHANFLNNPL